ncbi:hypothetical protein Tco_1110411 [Tanacetum coccineum]|uniref:Uncharacterized protein n=1 Tax=Tanacetum coccineum TaxID=301880 RepID=A0ABQ5IL49_9ASTR
MDSFRDSSINNEHNSGTDDTKASEEMDSKLNITNKKQQIWARRKTNLDVEKPPGLSRSYSFDSILSRTRVVDAQDDPSLPPYDTIENYISPRPKYLRFNPDRHSAILARQENVTRLIKGMSFDCGVLFLDVESSDDCSVEDTEGLVKESLVSTHDESEGEKEEFQDGNGWSRNVLLQYLIVVILLTLMIVTICLMNSPTVSHSEVGYTCFSPMKWDTKDLKLSSYELVKMQHGHTTKVTEIEVDVNKDEIDEMETRQIEAEKESYAHILGADLDVAEESAIVKPTVEEDDSTNNGPYDTKTEGKKDTDTLLSKLANVDPKLAAFSGVVVIILACASVLYYLIHRVTVSAHKNEVSEESSSSVGSGSIYSESSNF